MSNTSQILVPNCSILAQRSDFAEYIRAINGTTSFLPEVLETCKSNICAALWGDGNADVSGIGMILGYIFESVLGLLFALSLVFKAPTFTSKPSTHLSDILKTGSDVYFQCAVFFTASIQISCVVVLARKDFAVSANGMGGLTVQITWAIALLCMLSLLYPMVVLNFTDRNKSNHRFFLFCGCWLLFFYTFVSRMIGDFAPTQVGEGAGEGGQTIITIENWESLESLCFNGVQTLGSIEQKVLTGFGATGSIVVSIYGLGYLLWFIAKQHSFSKIEAIEERFQSDQQDLGRKLQRKIVLWATLGILILSVPQIWGILRLRVIQQAMARASGNDYVDNQWTFGQVVSVMLFAPVFTEMVYSWVKKSGKSTEQMGSLQINTKDNRS